MTDSPEPVTDPLRQRIRTQLLAVASVASESRALRLAGPARDLTRALLAVLDRHHEEFCEKHTGCGGMGTCAACGGAHPCPTVRDIATALGITP